MSITLEALDDLVRAQGVVVRGGCDGFHCTSTVSVGSPIVELSKPVSTEQIGQSIWIQYAANGSVPLVATILERIDATHVQLSTPALISLANAETHIFAGDDTQAFRYALAALEATGDELVLTRPFYAVSEQVSIGDGSTLAPSTVQNIRIKGRAAGTGDVMANDVHGCRIFYIGAPILPKLITGNGPIALSLDGVCIDCALRVDEALDAMHVMRGSWHDSTILRARKTGVLLDAYPSPTDVYTGGSGNQISQNYISMAGVTGAVGWKIGSRGSYPGLDVATTSMDTMSVLVSDDVSLSEWQAEATPTMSACMELGYVDNLYVRDFFAYVGGRRIGHGIRIKPKASAPWYPCEVNFHNAVLLGGVGYDFSEGPWTPDANSGAGLGFYPLNVGDMTDNGGGKKPAPLPESRFLGGREGINGCTHTMIILDRHQTEHWRDGFLTYGASVLRRKNAPTQVANTNAPMSVANWVIPANGLRIFDRTPNANVYRWDRQIRLEASGSVLNNTAAAAPLTIKAYCGATLVFNSGAISLAPSLYYRSCDLFLTLQARNQSNLQMMRGRIEIYTPGSGGAVAAGIDVTRGQTQSGLTINGAVDQDLRIEATLGVADPNVVFNLNFATVVIL